MVVRFTRDLVPLNTAKGSHICDASNEFKQLDMRWYNALGADARENRVLYCPPRLAECTDLPECGGNVVYFPGDLQEEFHVMQERGSRWISRSLEHTAELLGRKFPGKAIWVIKPCKQILGTFSCFSNFCAAADAHDGGAVQSYDAVHGSACLHLSRLLSAAAAQVAADSGIAPSASLTLVGFSKGAVVLNQIVTELGACSSSSTSSSAAEEVMTSARSFIASFLPAAFVPASFLAAWEQRKRERTWSSADSVSNTSSSSSGSSTSGSCYSSDSGAVTHEGAEEEQAQRKRRKLRAAYVAGFASTPTKPISAESSTEASCSDSDFNSSSSSSSNYNCSSTSNAITAAAAAAECSTHARSLFSRVVAVHWLDSGNGRLRGSLPTDSASLQALAQLQQQQQPIALHVHGSPYQLCSSSRPWLKRERDAFSSALPAAVVHEYFKGEAGTLDRHFSVLDVFEKGPQCNA